MDNLANMFVMIKNASAVNKESVVIPFTKLKVDILEVMEKAGFIKEISKKGKKNKRLIGVTLKYDEAGVSAISEIKRMSKPSRRMYLGVKDIKPVQQGYGLEILSTPKGVMSGKEAKKQKVGGEIICRIW